MMFNGYTRELTEEERAANEVKACQEILEEAKTDSEREYWQARLELAEKYLEDVSNVG